jgi:hypothetical protein
MPLQNFLVVMEFETGLIKCQQQKEIGIYRKYY